MSKTVSSTILFLDFDGVLHPDRTFMGKNGPFLKGDGNLFMWAPLLAEIIFQFPQCKIVLSTSWVRILGFKRSCKYLPDELKARVIGATWHSALARDVELKSWWDSASRYEQICRHAAGAQLENWISIDDDISGWPVEAHFRLVPCDPEEGLGNPAALEQLRVLLSGAVEKGGPGVFRTAKK